MKIISADYTASAVKQEQFPKIELPEFAFVGRSNVGKSTLLNSLLNRKKLAHTSSTPGKTRTINFFLINNSFYFVDLPGYGYARVSMEMKKSWGIFAESYLRERETLKLIIMLVDIRHPPTDQDRDMYEWLIHFDLPTVIVATKTDKISRSKRQLHVDQIRKGLGLGPQGPVILYSAETGEGKEEVWRRIVQYL
ncbi:MAG: YihA family ribosome biogenesis GTP-binding protein [Dethiobacter sp.]|jgi:GTP-binding protein|nr:YihA family ribosome biogenesis GTP-binding protein [Dethiobacter sp.]